jgi:hypothetical protein
VLTALPFFLGLAPMIFEQSMQAHYLVPMAISLGCGFSSPALPSSSYLDVVI